MRIGANLPHSLWPELVKTAGYLMNRTPVMQLNGRTPFEALTGRKPSVNHLRIVGCKAFCLRKKIDRKMKLDARSLIGYLVNYDSRNIYRIWHPAGRTIIRTRDVTFDEGQRFNPQEQAQLAQLSTLETATETIDLSADNDLEDAGDVTDDSVDGNDSENDPETITIRPRSTGDQADRIR
ncbi:hypothetical protein CLAIMM_15225 [Cladophialophora immunda]|nr:hypothetical protein CLAIMM_15225 [Cladophialophora immunda]